ncbi:hypothetical protein JAAARDRAFT_28848 [Jaapia argillacea MUCL 33604]|uniref:Tyrosine specific protein phosphatases domain-containing protein n=1 Tax=Jaapia argillacea MUCL 33604 TaxID=933084 RepID=A0A067QJT7_9AGAM|nr:hypothetical protein JAAARDRAFT_28848 [Jaapia argillacea MUCL 33604]
MDLRPSQGYLGLFGSPIDEIAAQSRRTFPTRNRDAAFVFKESLFHITLITKDELRNIPKDTWKKLHIDTAHVYPVGVGTHPKAKVAFVVIIWAAGQQARKRLGLPPKQFHITLTTCDVHDIDKGIDSILPETFIENPSIDCLDHLSYTLHLSGDYIQARKSAVDLCLSSPASERGFLRLADAAVKGEFVKLAMLACARAYERTSGEKVRDYCLRRMVECSGETEWGNVFSGSESSQLPEELHSVLMVPWTRELRDALSEGSTIPTLCLESRDRCYIPSPSLRSTPSFYTLPRFFRWLVPFHIALMSTPRHEDDITALASGHLGMRHILTLTEETPLHKAWFLNKGITNTYLPIPNYHPPTIEQMDLIMRLLDDESKMPVLIHCGGGKGRAGTVAACYLAAYGFAKSRPARTQPEMSATEAIDALRRIRPGSIETSQQEAFVHKWCSTIWKRQSILPDLVPEPSPCSFEVEGELKGGDLFVLVGLPGSGKSWFSKALIARDPMGWTRISQDDAGSRSACEVEIGHKPLRGRALLDRCNPSSDDRKSWLSLASTWSTSPICVWFDYTRELCTSRAQNRPDHPTLPPGSRVRSAVEQMDKMFVRPSLKEGFKAIIIVRSFSAAQDLVLRLSPPVTLFKFPRTSHILNLGAASDDDLVETGPIAPITTGHVVITEKVDGANMGFQLSSDRSSVIVQNRSHYINSSSHEQFKKLDLWIDKHREGLYKILDRDPFFADRFVLFGEWLAVTHSIPYTHLPDRFLAFDLYDRSTTAWADRPNLMRLLEGTGICAVPTMHEGGMPTHDQFRDMVQRRSRFYEGRVEGVYVKVEKNGRVVTRGKVVRADFIAGNEHWTKGILRTNNVSDGVE